MTPLHLWNTDNLVVILYVASIVYQPRIRAHPIQRLWKFHGKHRAYIPKVTFLNLKYSYSYVRATFACKLRSKSVASKRVTLSNIVCLNGAGNRKFTTQDIHWISGATTVVIFDVDKWSVSTCVLRMRYGLWRVVFSNRVLYAQKTAFRVNCAVYRQTSTGYGDRSRIVRLLCKSAMICEVVCVL
jgi:hypothetical protein